MERRRATCCEGLSRPENSLDQILRAPQATTIDCHRRSQDDEEREQWLGGEGRDTLSRATACSSLLRVCEEVLLRFRLGFYV